MQRLAVTLASAADPAVLEIRILANHGSDPRFAFLRKGGQWSEQWAALRTAKPGAAVQAPVSALASGAGAGLVAYGSDSEEEEEEPEEPPQRVEASSIATDGVDEAARIRKEAKAEKARAWAIKRKLAREAAEDDAPAPA